MSGRSRPTFALLAAHAHATKNRAIRELGRSGAFALTLFLVLIGGTFLAPLWLAMLGLGFLLGKSLDVANPSVEALLGVLLFGISYLGGATSGTVSGAKQLTWEAYRTYPVRLRSVFLAEVVASSVDLMPIVLGVSTAAFCVGLCIANVKLVPLAPFVLVEGVLGALVAQLLVGTLAERLVRRLRVALGVLALVLAVGIVLGTMVNLPTPEDPLVTALASLSRLRVPLEHAALVLPTTWAARSLAALAQGRVADACVDQLVPLGTLGLLAFITARLLDREVAADASGSAEQRAPRLWSFRTAAAGIARLQLATIMDSRVGRFGLVFPLVVVVLVRGPLTVLFGRTPWAVPGAFIYVALLGSQFQLNQFGLDAHGTKTLLLLPIGEADLWRGKARGLLVYQSMQAIGLGAFLTVVQRPSWVELASGVLVFFAMVTVENTVGRATSVLVPRMLPRKRVQSNATPIGLVLVALTLSLGFGGLVGTMFAVLGHRAPAWRPVVAALLLATAVITQRALLPSATRRLRRRKETLLAALG